MPADLMRAINHAHTVLSWQENLTEEEIPPEWMWALDDPLEEWFDEISEARKERYGGTRTGARDRERDTTVPMMSNDLVSTKRRR